MDHHSVAHAQNIASSMFALRFWVPPSIIFLLFFTLRNPSSALGFCQFFSDHFIKQFPLCPSSYEPPGSSIRDRELFCSSAQRFRQQQSVFFWSQRPPPLPAGGTKTWSHRQPASGHHRPHEGKDDIDML